MMATPQCLRFHSCLCRVMLVYRRGHKTHYKWAVQPTRSLVVQTAWLRPRARLWRHKAGVCCRLRTTGYSGLLPVRWNSSGPQGGRGSRKGFFQNFLSNLRKSMEKNKEMQESLKGFEEERSRLQESYWVQAAKQKWAEGVEKTVVYGTRGYELAKTMLARAREQLSRSYKDASQTEVGKKGQELGAQIAKSAQETAEKVSETASELSKTDVGKTISQGATVVKEELLDDIIKESAPYKPPDKMRMRSEMADTADSAQEAEKIIEPNEDAKEVVLTRTSRWKQQWKSLRENNPLTNTFYNLKMKYDESDHLVIRASRAVTDRLGDAFGGVMTQSDMAEALAEIRKIDPSFNKEEFVKQCQFDIIPTILEAFLRGNLEILKDWCHEASFNVLSAIIKQRTEPGVQVECKVLEVRDVDIVLAKLLDEGPVMVLTFQAQQLTSRRGKEGEVKDELLENIHYVWALCRDQTIYGSRAAWRVAEFAIQASGKLLV